MFHNLFSSFTHIFINIDIYSGSGGKESAEIQEAQVWSLGLKDPLEEGMATPCSILACRIPRTEESGGPQSIGSQRVEHDWETKIVSLFTRTHVALYPTYFMIPIDGLCVSYWDFPGVSVVKNSPAVQESQETWAQSLGWEDPLEKEMATHSSILAWRIQARWWWTDWGAWQATVRGGCRNLDMTEMTGHTRTHPLKELSACDKKCGAGVSFT